MAPFCWPEAVVARRIPTGVDLDMVTKIQDLLISMDGTEGGSRVLEGVKNPSKFDPIAGSEMSLEELKNLMNLMGQE